MPIMPSSWSAHFFFLSLLCSCAHECLPLSRTCWTCCAVVLMNVCGWNVGECSNSSQTEVSTRVGQFQVSEGYKYFVFISASRLITSSPPNSGYGSFMFNYHQLIYTTRKSTTPPHCPTAPHWPPLLSPPERYLVSRHKKKTPCSFTVQYKGGP